jgi:hypothetical protein
MVSVSIAFLQTKQSTPTLTETGTAESLIERAMIFTQMALPGRTTFEMTLRKSAGSRTKRPLADQLLEGGPRVE